MHVRIRGLVKAAKWNGRTGIICGSQTEGRVPVRVLNLETRGLHKLSIKVENLGTSLSPRSVFIALCQKKTELIRNVFSQELMWIGKIIL